MKKQLIYVSMIALGLSILVASCSKTAPQTSTSTQAGTSAIVYVNSDSLLSKYEYFTSIKDKFEEKSKKAQADLKAENEKLYEKVAAFLKGFAKEKGYKMVLTYSKANPTVLFADESLDVTKEVVAGLNEAYAKDKK